MRWFVGVVLVVALALALTGCGGSNGPYLEAQCSAIEHATNAPVGCVTLTYPDKPTGYANLPACAGAVPPTGQTACRDPHGLFDDR